MFAWKGIKLHVEIIHKTQLLSQLQDLDSRIENY